jgi:hypothetical protein
MENQKEEHSEATPSVTEDRNEAMTAEEIAGTAEPAVQNPKRTNACTYSPLVFTSMSVTQSL